MWLLLLPQLAWALTAAEVLDVSKEAVRICSLAETYRAELAKTDPKCLETKICREAVQECYTKLFTTCPEVIGKLQEIAKSAKCPKKEERNCRLDRKLMRSLGEMATDLRKTLDKTLADEKIDRACDEYDKAFRHDKYGTCPTKAEVTKVHDLQKKLLTEAVLPLERLLKEFAEGRGKEPDDAH